VPVLSPGGEITLPLAGVGVLFGALALSLIMGGAVGELVYATGEIDLSRYSRLLAISRTKGQQFMEDRASSTASRS
jgi:hypothetical protein